MEKSGKRSTRNFRGPSVSSAVVHSTFDLAAGLANMLRPYTPKAIARRIGASPRTVENWKEGENGPTWKHAVAMLNDDELCSRLLEAAGRGDLAKHQETIAALKAALLAEGK